MSIVESFSGRFEGVLAATLARLASPNQSVTYGVSVGMVEIECEEHVHEVPALLVIWAATEGTQYDVSAFHLTITPEPMTDEDLVVSIEAAWTEMVFARQAISMSDLDDAMDALSDGEE